MSGLSLLFGALPTAFSLSPPIPNAPPVIPPKACNCGEAQIDTISILSRTSPQFAFPDRE